jgi:hypothetical protein
MQAAIGYLRVSIQEQGPQRLGVGGAPSGGRSFRTSRWEWSGLGVSAALDSAYHGTQQETTELESRRNRT